ncbi:MAG: hypothetical protein OSJ69_15185, partial [Acetatifactor sp.]|nr:hypothetical protein [Acetatifactor sp.]
CKSETFLYIVCSPLYTDVFPLHCKIEIRPYLPAVNPPNSRFLPLPFRHRKRGTGFYNPAPSFVRFVLRQNLLLQKTEWNVTQQDLKIPCGTVTALP